MIRARTSFLAVALLAAVVLAPAALHADDPKVVILGFDGADAELAEQWMDEGHLPNLAKLRDAGAFRPLRSTVPSQTPVSWSTFATGLDPGRHAIFDFLKRDPKTYTPGFAAFDETRVPFLWGENNPPVLAAIAGGALLLLLFLGLKLLRVKTWVAAVVALVLGGAAAAGAYSVAAAYLPVDRPLAINRQQGETFWEVLGEAGKDVRVIRVPVTFPPDDFHNGTLLSGLGTPDLSFRIGKPFFFTSELFFEPATGDFSGEIVELIDNRGEIPTEIKGPPNKLFPESEQKYVTIPMTLTVAEDRSSLGIEVSGQSFELAPGEWSNWVRFTFPFNRLVKLHGIGRFHLMTLEDEVRLYLSPIQFDPTKLPPVVDLTTPADWVDELTDDYGLFKTIGWSVDTWSMTEQIIDEELFLEDTEFGVQKYEEMFYGELAKDDWDVLVHYFEFTDRIQHVMWRLFDPKHPIYDAEKAAQYGDSILWSYQDMDRIVGEAMDRMPEDAILMVVSDHGFASFRRSMNYNTWLAQNGYMRLKGEDAERRNLEQLFDKGDFFVNVDWSKTRAYALGLGQIYINLKGREAQGIVEPGEEYETLLAEIKEGLESYVDPETGENPVAYVWRRDEVYESFDPELIPDLIPSNSDGYRVGWQDSLGGIAKDVVEDNVDVWSGDHCSVYPPLVDGILFANVPVAAERPYMADVMPTLLQIYGVEPPTELDGESLLPADWEPTAGR